MQAKVYNPQTIEKKWQTHWQEEKVHQIDLKTAENPYFSHVMFPYPSGDKLHVGHWYNYAPADTFARYKKLQGFDVFTPMGFDSFGLPAENYAIKTGVHPSQSIAENVARMRTQLKRIGCMYDWSKTVQTSLPDYYKWTQFVFLKLYEQGLAYQKVATVNWDPIDQTVLANEQVLPDGTAERSGAKVIQKPLKQWFFKISDYTQELLDNLENLDWPKRTKLMQQNWIGRSEGALIDFELTNSQGKISVYSTRIDTLFSGTFIILAPEHPLVTELKDRIENWMAVAEYIEQAASKTEIDRTSDANKSGVELKGLTVVNPATGREMPVWIADFVIAHYGTGAVFADAHDQRDFEMAKAYDIPLAVSVLPQDGTEDQKQKIINLEECFSGHGVLFNSAQFDGLTSEESKPKITAWLAEQGMAQSRVQYRLRDWLISRQRYWGSPIPIVYDPEGRAHPVPEKHLPWELPEDVEFKPQGFAPLAQSAALKKRTEEIFGAGWTPEVDTMDTFVCSSFYSNRYLADGNADQFISPEIEKKWLPVDCYIGGPEHACMHLIYTRFVQMALADAGVVKIREPYQKLIHQGMITNDGAKMSKSKGNVVSPDSFVDTYGSDVFRMYLMFMGPFEQGGDWSDTGIKGIDRFAKKVFSFFNSVRIEEADTKPETLSLLHQTIEKITADIENFNFNTAISALMILINHLNSKKTISPNVAGQYLTLLAPFAPHLAEELWSEVLGRSTSVFDANWPKFDSSLVVKTAAEFVVQVNGKVRAKISAGRDDAKDSLIVKALAAENIENYITDPAQIKKTIVVPGKLINFVV